ncbi:hypothetical protein TrCOL_g8363 [Triparma columacea]|nr:hypothetical protein TrCOL_g8363 [Triparma columacea]
MENPELVGECVSAMKSVLDPVGIQVSVKCRIGVDSADTYPDLRNFITTVSQTSGCRTFQVHARKAVLDGTFSPVDNRNIPPLKYDYVYRLKEDFPDLSVTLNGGVNSISDVLSVAEACKSRGGGLDGVMVGRGVVAQPWYWCTSGEVLYGGERGGGVKSRRELIREYGIWADKEEEWEGSKKGRRRILRPVVNIFNGEMGGKRWRNRIDDIMKTAGSKRKGYKDETGDDTKLSELLEKALEVMEPSIVDQTKEETMEIMLLKEEIIQGGTDSGGGVDGVAREAIKVWNEERRERERLIKEDEGDIEEDALRAGGG